MINNVVLMGRLTKDIEVKNVGSQNIPVTRFTLAVDGRSKDSDTNFIDCIAWRGTAEFLQKYFGKGDMLALTGELTTSTYEKDGVKRKNVEVNVTNVSFCGGKNSTREQSPIAKIEGAVETTDEELPF